jgi:CheY-like chemotaxis protein
VHAVCNNDYLLVLMDMRLPGMDGITATQEIRKAEREGGTSSERPCTIVAMTADASPEFRHKALQSGMQDVVTKPVKFDVLKEVLEKYLPRENRSSSTSSMPSLPTSLASSTSGGAMMGSSSDGVPPPSSPSPRVAPKS